MNKTDKKNFIRKSSQQLFKVQNKDFLRNIQAENKSRDDAGDAQRDWEKMLFLNRVAFFEQTMKNRKKLVFEHGNCSPFSVDIRNDRIS